MLDITSDRLLYIVNMVSEYVNGHYRYHPSSPFTENYAELIKNRDAFRLHALLSNPRNCQFNFEVVQITMTEFYRDFANIGESPYMTFRVSISFIIHYWFSDFPSVENVYEGKKDFTVGIRKTEAISYPDKTGDYLSHEIAKCVIGEIDNYLQVGENEKEDADSLYIELVNNGVEEEQDGYSF